MKNEKIYYFYRWIVPGIGPRKIVFTASLSSLSHALATSILENGINEFFTCFFFFFGGKFKKLILCHWNRLQLELLDNSPTVSSIAEIDRAPHWNQSQLPVYVSTGNACECVLFAGNSIRSTALVHTKSTQDPLISNCPDSGPAPQRLCLVCDLQPHKFHPVLLLQWNQKKKLMFQHDGI